MARSIKEVQQDFAENLGFREEIIWDLLSADQGNILKDKIKELIPDQKKGQNAIEECRTNLFERVWAQRKYTNGNSLSALIYVLVTKEEDFNKASDSMEYSIHPVFRTRKCIADDDSSNCCMIFIDENGRVYPNWKSYVEDNELPKYTMIAPKNGIYSFDENNKVKLEIYKTPSGTIGRQALVVTDVTSAGAGLAAACVPIAAMCAIPVAAPVMAGAAVVGIASAGYSLLRSGASLVDRSQHEQSIGLGDRQARSSWLGVVAGAVGLGAMGATKAVTTLAATGREISAVTEFVVNGMNISSIVLSGTGVANGALDLVLKYRDDEKITFLDAVQLSASLVLFTHSVYNFRLASRLISDAQNRTFQRYRESLSNRQRRMFDKMSKETIRLHGPTRGKLDIIRSVNEIPSKQYLNDLYKINKNLNENNVRPAFNGDGKGILLNNEVLVESQVLRDSVQHKVGPDVLGQVKQSIPQSHNEAPTSQQMRVPVQLLFVNHTNEASIGPADQDLDGANRTLAAGVRVLLDCSILLSNGAKILLWEFGDQFFENIINAESFENVITHMGELFEENAFRFLMLLARTFIEYNLEEIHTVIRTFISTESVLYRILKHCEDNYHIRTCEFLDARTGEIIGALENYFLSLNPNSFPELLKKCEHCSGYFAVKAI